MRLFLSRKRYGPSSAFLTKIFFALKGPNLFIFISKGTARLFFFIFGVVLVFFWRFLLNVSQNFGLT